MKVHPILYASTEFRLGDRVVISDTDDDMHGKEGIFHGRYQGKIHKNLCYLILLTENQKYIQVSEHQLLKKSKQ